MLEIVDNLFDIRTMIWLFPIIFMFHDLEETITIESFMANYQEVPKTIAAKWVFEVKRKLGGNSAQFAVAVVWMLLIISFVTFMIIHFPHNHRILVLFTAALNIFFVQTFSHIGQTLIFKAYTPGVVTAFFVVIPYSLLTYSRLLESGLIDGNLLRESVPVSLLMIPLFLIGNLLGRQFIR